MSRRPFRDSLWWRRWAYRARVVEAMGLLCVFGVAQLWIPMPSWPRVLGRPAPVPRGWGTEAQPRLRRAPATLAEQRAAGAVARARTALPWTPSCLAEAAAAQVLLRQAGESGVVVIGLRRQDDGPWDAHAWLLGRRGALTGGPAAQGFTATTVYEHPGGLRAAEVELTAVD